MCLFRLTPSALSTRPSLLGKARIRRKGSALGPGAEGRREGGVRILWITPCDTVQDNTNANGPLPFPSSHLLHHSPPIAYSISISARLITFLISILTSASSSSAFLNLRSTSSFFFVLFPPYQINRPAVALQDRESVINVAVVQVGRWW